MNMSFIILRMCLFGINDLPGHLELYQDHSCTVFQVKSRLSGRIVVIFGLEHTHVLQGLEGQLDAGE